MDGKWLIFPANETSIYTQLETSIFIRDFPVRYVSHNQMVYPWNMG